MNETPPDAWFYSREGERIGPVTFAELKVKATEAALNPRLDMVWTHGMPEWKPAGEIDGLFERRATPEAPRKRRARRPIPIAPPQPRFAGGTHGRGRRLAGCPAAEFSHRQP